MNSRFRYLPVAKLRCEELQGVNRDLKDRFLLAEIWPYHDVIDQGD